MARGGNTQVPPPPIADAVVSRSQAQRVKNKAAKARKQAEEAKAQKANKGGAKAQEAFQNGAKVTELRTKAKAKAIRTVRRLPRRQSPSDRKSATVITTATSAPKGPLAPVRTCVRFARDLTLRRVVLTSD